MTNSVATGGDAALTRVLVVNTADVGGGAERSAMSIVEGFEALGTQTWLGVGQKQTDDPRVMTFYASPFVDYRPHARREARAARALGRLVDRTCGIEDFRHPFSRHILELTGVRPDLVLCANLHGGYFDLRILPWLCEQVPVVLRLSDSWTFTGHCAVPRGCDRWETGCGACPDLSTPPAVQRDATRLNWHRKRRIFAASRLAVVSPSQWMLDRAQRSLLGAEKPATVIPSGVDLATFRPGPRQQARSRLGLGEDELTLLYVANGGSENPFKDFAILRAAAATIARNGPGRRLRLLVVGGDEREEAVDDALTIVHRRYTSSREHMGDYYRASDVYVHAALEDTLPLVMIEALACGIPVVSTASSGPAEIVDDGITGLLAPDGTASQIASALEALIDDPDRRAAMGRAACQAAEARFDARVQIAKLHAWCTDLAERWHGARA